MAMKFAIWIILRGSRLVQGNTFCVKLYHRINIDFYYDIHLLVRDYLSDLFIQHNNTFGKPLSRLLLNL